MGYDANEYITGDFLKKEDLETSKNWVIKGIKKADLDDQKKLELELHYKEEDKNFTLNTTNTKRLIGIFGNQTDNWLGRVITLKTVETEYKGKPATGIRINEEATLTHEANKDATIKEENVRG